MTHQQSNCLLQRCIALAIVMAVFAGTLPCIADKSCYLNFHGTSANYDYYYNVEDVHKLTFSSSDLTVKFVDNSSNKPIKYKTLRKITIGSNTIMNVENVRDDISLTINFTGDAVYVKNVESLSLVTIYNMSGQQLLSLSPNASTAIISLDGYHPGVYIVQAISRGNIVTQKIIK